MISMPVLLKKALIMKSAAGHALVVTKQMLQNIRGCEELFEEYRVFS